MRHQNSWEYNVHKSDRETKTQIDNKDIKYKSKDDKKKSWNSIKNKTKHYKRFGDFMKKVPQLSVCTRDR